MSSDAARAPTFSGLTVLQATVCAVGVPYLSPVVPHHTGLLLDGPVQPML